MKCSYTRSLECRYNPTIWNGMKKFHFSSSTSMNFIDCESSGNHKIPIFFYILLVTVELYDCVIKKGVGTSGT